MTRASIAVITGACGGMGRLCARDLRIDGGVIAALRHPDYGA